MKHDWLTLTFAILLSVGGIVSIISSEGGLQDGIPPIAERQLIFLGIALILFFIFSFINYRFYAKIAAPLYIVMLIILIVVLVVGAERGGAGRWIMIGPYQFQPSEHSKLLSVIVLAAIFNELPEHFKDRFTFITALALMIPVWILIAIEPDLGTTMIVFTLFLAMSFLSKISWRIPVTFVLMVLLLIPIAWPLMKDYQKNRISAFLNPTADPLGKGYQLNQSIIAIGSGGLTGKGLFQGTQNNLNFIPSQSTDFIFSIVGEEGGFVFSSLVIVLYMFMFLRLGSIAIRAPDYFGSLIVWGVCSFLFLQTFVNVGMTIGLMPVTGLPLPFMSYGINSLLVGFVSLGVVSSVYRYSLLSEKRP